MNLRTLSALTLGTLLGFMATPGHATLIAYDTFNSYTSGDPLDGGSGGFGWDTNWIDDGSDNVTAQAGVIPGWSTGMQITDPSGNTDRLIRRSFDNQGYADTLYVGMLLRRNSDFAGDDFVQFWMNDGSNDQVNSASAGFRQNTDKDIFARSKNVTDDGPSTSEETTYQVVLKISKSGATYNRSDVFVNQLFEGSPDATAAGGASDTGLSQINTFNVRTYFFDNDGEAAYIDELRIATTYAEALAVPEPTSVLGLLGLITGTFFRRRRRTLA